MRRESWTRWAFGIHSWRFLTFPVALGTCLLVAYRSPIALIRMLGWGLVLFYVAGFVAVLTGRLTLPRE